MKPRPVRSWIAWLLMAALSFPSGLAAQQPDKIAALKTSLAANQKLQRQYKWVETTVISMKGEEKSRLQKQVFYGPDGALQKQPLSAPPPQSSPGGAKGKIAEKKKAEITAAMQQAADLIHQYVPPDIQKIQAVKAAGNLAIVPVGPDSTRIDLKNYLKSGDTLSLGLDTAGNAMQTVSVKSYMKSKDDAVTLDVTFARLRGGLSYPASTVLNVPGEKIHVVVQNSNYEKVTPAGTATSAPAAKPAAAPTSMTAIDSLTAPIALYPDALIAQILQASVDFPGVQKFAGWMKANASLKGSALQDAAQAAGFAPPLVALAPFPQVVQMMVDKPDWTQQLGKAFAADKKAVLDSIQHLRAMAQAMGNLKTTEQQAVSTESTSAGQQVIVIQPANPQVIYVPVYTQVVYVQPAPPPPPPSSTAVAGAALVGFTVGVIIASSHNHYYGGWHAYDEAWDRREDYYEDRQDYAEDRREDTREYQDERRDAGQQNQSQRQSTAQGNQSSRQSTAQSSQSNRQSTAETNQSTRQTSGASQETAQSNQANRQSTSQTNQSSRQSTAQGNQGSRQSTAYQSGGSARAQSSRGSASRGGGGGRRR